MRSTTVPCCATPRCAAAKVPSSGTIRPPREQPANMSRLLDPKKGQRRQKYEFCVVLCVRASTWKDGLLSRFTADDKRMDEGKGKAEEALKAMRDAGLTIKVKKHSTKDGSRLLMVFVTAELVRVRARVRVRVGVGVGVGVSARVTVRARARARVG